MTKRRQSVLKEAVEIRRLTFRTSVPLERSGVRDVAFSPLGGDEYLVSPANYADLVRALRRVGYDVRTVSTLYNELPYIHYQLIRCGFWYRSQRDYPGSWYYLSPLTRRWQRLPTDGSHLVLRNGWCLCRFADRRRSFYYLEQGKNLDECKCRGDTAILQAYGGMVGRLTVPYWEDNDFLYVLWPGYVIPKTHERFLTENLSPLESQLETKQGELWTWRKTDGQLIEDCLRGLHLELRKWSASDHWVPTLSAILKHSYRTHLSRQEGIDSFADMMWRRAWHEIDDHALRSMLEQLGNAEYQGDSTASRVLDYLSKRVATAIGWRDHPHETVFGLVLEASALSYGERRTESTYYRVAFPNLEIVTGWKTKILRDWPGSCLPCIVVSKWRVLPYLGRMRTAPQAKPVCALPEESDIESTCRALLAVPKIEWELTEKSSMDAFSLDYDPRSWHGYNDLVRCSAACAQVIAYDPAECDMPGLLLDDVLGFRFVLRTPGLSRQERPEIGEWVRYVGRVNLSDYGATPLPTFTLIDPHLLTPVHPGKALFCTLLAAVKYHFGITLAELRAFLEGSPLAEVTDEAMARLVDRDDILAVRGRYYYRYSMATSEQMTSYITRRQAEDFDLPFDVLRDLLHPLSPRAHYLHDNTEHPFSSLGHSWSVYVLKQSQVNLVETILQLLDAKGRAEISGRGARRSERASVVVDEVCGHFRLGELLVHRQENTFVSEDEKEIPQRAYTLLYPARILQLRFE